MITGPPYDHTMPHHFATALLATEDRGKKVHTQVMLAAVAAGLALVHTYR